MKTPLTELIEKWESELGSYIPHAPIYILFINEAKTFLEKEQEHIEIAYENGAIDFQSGKHEVTIGDGNDYFIKTYQNTEKHGQ